MSPKSLWNWNEWKYHKSTLMLSWNHISCVYRLLFYVDPNQTFNQVQRTVLIRINSVFFLFKWKPCESFSQHDSSWHTKHYETYTIGMLGLQVQKRYIPIMILIYIVMKQCIAGYLVNMATSLSSYRYIQNNSHVYYVTTFQFTILIAPYD